MFKARETNRALQTLRHSRTFSSTPQRPAISPYRRATQATAASKENASIAKRPSSSIAAASQPVSTQEPRPRPSPAFNRVDYKDVQPLKPNRQPELDHSFVGMTGGEIFHEMMLRLNVKHICTHCSFLMHPFL